MNSLTAKGRLPQLRIIPVPGVQLFRYERRVANRWVVCNHSRAVGVVGVYNRRAKALCKSLTANTATGEASQCTSQDTTGKSSRSFSGVKAMSMNVCSLLSGSGKSLQGSKNEH